jgi:orotate phosphoribosyltransferase
MYDQQALIRLVRERSLKFGDFVLASGKRATYYLDGKQVTLSAEGLRLVSEGLFELIKDLNCQAVGGMSIGADPLVAGVLVVAAEHGRSLDGFLVRKEAKGHGTNKFIEGPVQPEMRAVLVEDVVTTGGSSLLAAERAESFGMKVTHILAIIDRMEGGREAFQKKGRCNFLAPVRGGDRGGAGITRSRSRTPRHQLVNSPPPQPSP